MRTPTRTLAGATAQLRAAVYDIMLISGPEADMTTCEQNWHAGLRNALAVLEGQA